MIKKNRILIERLIIIIIALVTIVLLIMMIQKQIEYKNIIENELAVQTMQYNVYTNQVSKIETGEINKENLLEKQEELKNKVPSNLTQDNIYYGLKKLAVSKNIMLNDVNFNDVKFDGDIAIIDTEINVYGEYNKLLSFVNEIENGETIFNIKAFSFSSNNADGNSNLYINLSSFYMDN